MTRGIRQYGTGLIVALLGTWPAAAQPPSNLPPVPVPITAPGAGPGAVPTLPPQGLPAVVVPAQPPPQSPHVPPGLQAFPEPHTAEGVRPVVLEPAEHAEHEGKVDGAGAFLMDVEYLYLKVRRRPLDYAISSSNTIAGPVGTVLSQDWEWRSGFRVGMGYRFAGGLEAVFNYTYFHSSNNGLADRPAGGTLLPTLAHPGFVQMVNRAAPEASFNYNVFDVEFAKRFHPAEKVDLRVFAGPRFARIDQGFNVTYDGNDANRDLVRSKLTFDGGGLRAGGEATYKIVNGLGLYTRGGASLLVGTTKSQLSEANNNGRTPIVDVNERFDKVIPVLDLGMGLSWQRGNFRLSAGYEFTNWFGLVDGIDFVDDAQVGKYMRRTGDLSLDGLAIRAEYSY